MTTDIPSYSNVPLLGNKEENQFKMLFSRWNINATSVLTGIYFGVNFSFTGIVLLMPLILEDIGVKES